MSTDTLRMYYWQNEDGGLSASTDRPEGVSIFLTEEEYVSRMAELEASALTFIQSITEGA